MGWTIRSRHIRLLIAALSILTAASCLSLWKMKQLHLHGIDLNNIISLKRQVVPQNLRQRNSTAQTSESIENEIWQDSKVLEDEAVTKLRRSSFKKIILLWDDIGMSRSPGRPDRQMCGNCELTKNHTLIDNPDTAAVVFYYKAIAMKTMPPLSARNPNQLYVFWNKEPTPLMRYVHHKELDFEESYGFNATMTYRRDSDFFNTYRYHWIKASFKSGLKPEDLLKQKNRTGVAIISDCDWTAGARLRYRILQKIKALGFDFDGFGKCFPASEDFPKVEKELIKKVRSYKFFFAFENSYHCTDYITEKFYRNSLYAGAVPIVLGPIRNQYEVVAPPRSFIFLEDFATLADLVEYLRYLDKNDTAYLEYFRWRLASIEEASPYSQRKDPFCHLCRSLHGVNIDDTYNPKFGRPYHNVPIFTNGTATRTVPSLKKYLFEDEDATCLERNETALPIYTKYQLFNL